MENNPFKILYKDKKTSARVGKLYTRKGVIETPFFMPVATKATAKFVNPAVLYELGSRAIISNALILHIRPGEKSIKKMGGIGNFMNFAGVNVTDSGGFQMYTPSIYISSNDKGVYFKNPINGEKLFITPEHNMEIQFDIGSDIAMCLDRMPLYENSKEEISEAVDLTTKWAARCKKHHDKLQKKIPINKRQLLFGIVQGGIYKDLREKSATELSKLDFDGYSIGGLALPDDCYGRNKDKAKKYEYEAIKTAKKIIGDNKIVYLMGEGEPLEVMEAITRGIDMFDSKYPTETARRGTLLTSSGKIKILNKKYSYDKAPIDKNCKCFVCRNYTRSYIRHLLKEDEGVGKELASYHNLYFMQNLFSNIRNAIKKGKFLEFKSKIQKFYRNRATLLKLG